MDRQEKMKVEVGADVTQQGSRHPQDPEVLKKKKTKDKMEGQWAVGVGEEGFLSF